MTGTMGQVAVELHPEVTAELSGAADVERIAPSPLFVCPRSGCESFVNDLTSARSGQWPGCGPVAHLLELAAAGLCRLVQVVTR